MEILLTGGTGFVGRALVARLSSGLGCQLRLALRREMPDIPANAKAVYIDDISAATDWTGALSGCVVVIHAAARVHVMRDYSVDPLAEFRRINVEGTLKLARQAAQAGVKRFVYLSSIKVNGEETPLNQPFKADDRASPQDPYAISKHEAEEGLRKLAGQSGMEVVIIRPPLVYGPGVKANFHSMMGLLYRGVPLPFGAIHNQRSLLALDNLVDLIVTCIHHPAAANQIFLASDGEDLSTTELLRRLGLALGRPARLVPVPQAWLNWGGSLLGRKDLVRRLAGSLQVDISKTRDLLGWSPIITVDQALKQTARHFIDQAAR